MHGMQLAAAAAVHCHAIHVAPGGARSIVAPERVADGGATIHVGRSPFQVDGTGEGEVPGGIQRKRGRSRTPM